MPLPKSHIWQIDQTTTQRLIYTLLSVERYTVGKGQTDVWWGPTMGQLTIWFPITSKRFRCFSNYSPVTSKLNSCFPLISGIWRFILSFLRVLNCEQEAMAVSLTAWKTEAQRRRSNKEASGIPQEHLQGLRHHCSQMVGGNLAFTWLFHTPEFAFCSLQSMSTLQGPNPHSPSRALR